MDENIIIESRGFNINDLYIPSFKLKENEYVAFYLGNTLDDKIYKQFVSLFKKYKQSDQIEVKAPFVEISSYSKFSYGFLKNIFTNYYVEDYLSNLSTDKIEFIKSKFNLKNHQKIKSLGLGDKILLALEKNYFLNNNIIFCTVGLAPLSIEKIYQKVNDFLENGKSVIEVCYNSNLGIEAFDKNKLIMLK